jgi:ABC-2 type transport system permease protein
MKKYISIFKISFAQEFAYRVNFIMWRVRNIIQMFLVFFLWSTIFSNPQAEIFGYNKDKILTYVFGILLLRAIVLSARAVDVSGEISRGDITNFLLKPINYFKYWFTRDISSKALNLSFAVLEATALYFILKPPFFVQTNPFYLFLFLVSIVLAVFLFFHLLFLVNMIPFWVPEAGWAGQFLFIVIFTEFLSGGVFPIDILPDVFQKVIFLLPFPYLLFFPLQVYLGKLSIAVTLKGLGISLIWLLVLSFAVSFVWQKGIKKYEAVGR